MMRVEVFEGRQHSGEWPSEKAVEFLAWLTEKIDSIPAEYRATAKIDFDAEEDYGLNYVSINISYMRPETPREIEDGEAAERAYIARAIEDCKEQLARLKARAHE